MTSKVRQSHSIARGRGDQSDSKPEDPIAPDVIDRGNSSTQVWSDCRRGSCRDGSKWGPHCQDGRSRDDREECSESKETTARRELRDPTVGTGGIRESRFVRAPLWAMTSHCHYEVIRPVSE